MATLKKLECPQCGARLQPQPNDPLVTCGYCGTRSQVQGRSPPPQTPQMPHGQAPPQYPVATYQTPKGMWLVVLLPVALMIIGAGVSFVLSMKGSGAAMGAAGGGVQNVLVDWKSSGHPMLVDANGDGTSDVIGWLMKNEISTETVTDHLAAFDGRDGSRLWMSPSLGENASTQAIVAVAGDVVLVADKGVARALRLSDGQLRWKSQLGEQAERICGSEDGGAVLVRLRDERTVRLTLQDATIKPVEDEDPECVPVWSSESTPPSEAAVATGGVSITRFETNVEPEGMSVGRPLHQPGSEQLVVLGHKDPGTRVPMAGAYACGEVTRNETRMGGTAFECEQPELLWKSVVPATNPMEVDSGTPDIAALRDGVVYVGYEVDSMDDIWRVAAFEVETGRRIWDERALVEPASTDHERDLARIVPTDSGLFVDHGWGSAGMRDARTGEAKFAIAR